MRPFTVVFINIVRATPVKLRRAGELEDVLPRAQIVSRAETDGKTVWRRRRPFFRRIKRKVANKSNAAALLPYRGFLLARVSPWFVKYKPARSARNARKYIYLRADEFPSVEETKRSSPNWSLLSRSSPSPPPSARVSRISLDFIYLPRTPIHVKLRRAFLARNKTRGPDATHTFYVTVGIIIYRSKCSICARTNTNESKRRGPIFIWKILFLQEKKIDFDGHNFKGGGGGLEYNILSRYKRQKLWP